MEKLCTKITIKTYILSIGPDRKFYLPWLDCNLNPYIETSNNAKIYPTFSTLEDNGFTSDNEYNFHSSLDITKYDLTQNISLVIYFKDTPITFELEFIEE